MSKALDDITLERQRQVNQEGWTPEHDDEHDAGELAAAASCYADPTIATTFLPTRWPWDREWWKPTDQRRNLVKAGALIVAEIERLDRLTEQE
jgi:hypothetical protein